MQQIIGKQAKKWNNGYKRVRNKGVSGKVELWKKVMFMQMFSALSFAFSKLFVLVFRFLIFKPQTLLFSKIFGIPIFSRW